MNQILVLLASGCLLACTANGATVSLWTFESPNIPLTVVGNTIGGLLPAVGSGSAMGFHASAATQFSAGNGNGSATSLMANQWTPGDYWQFQVSTLGFADIHLSFDQIGNYFGATNFNLSYSLDGVSFTTFLSSYPVVPEFISGPWNSTAANPLSVRNVDLSAVSLLDNAPNVYFRLVNNVDAPFDDATGQIDNFQVTASAIPEPGHLVLLGLTTLLVLGQRQRR